MLDWLQMMKERDQEITDDEAEDEEETPKKDGEDEEEAKKVKKLCTRKVLQDCSMLSEL